MATVIKTGTFVFNTSGTGITIDLTGWGGGTPIAVILVGQDGTADDTLPVSVAANGYIGYGFSDGTHHYCIGSFAGTPNATAINLETTMALELLTAATPTVGTGGQITGVSFTSNTITLTQNANA